MWPYETMSTETRIPTRASVLDGLTQLSFSDLFLLTIHGVTLS